MKGVTLFSLDFLGTAIAAAAFPTRVVSGDDGDTCRVAQGKGPRSLGSPRSTSPTASKPSA